MKVDICNFKLPTNGTNEAENYNAEILVSDDVPECSLCEVKFNSLKDLEAHSLSLDHVQKVLKMNSLVSLPSDAYTALTSPLKHQNENICVDKIDKQEKYPIPREIDNALQEDKIIISSLLPYSCSSCNMKFSGRIPYQEHLKSKSHKKKDLLENNSIAEIKKIEGRMFCDICNLEFNGEIPFKDHLISKKHKRRELESNYLKETTDEDLGPEAKKMKMEPKLENQEQWFCKICRKQCSGPVPWREHLAGNIHKRNVARSETEVNIALSVSQFDSGLPINSNMNHVSTVAKRVSDPACFENISDTSITLEKTKAEVGVKKMEIDESKPAWFCSVCNLQCNGPIHYSSHCGGKSHKKKLLSYKIRNDFNNPEVSNVFYETKTNVNNVPKVSNTGSQVQIVCSEIIDYEKELKESVKIFLPSEEINFV